MSHDYVCAAGSSGLYMDSSTLRVLNRRSPFGATVQFEPINPQATFGDRFDTPKEEDQPRMIYMDARKVQLRHSQSLTRSGNYSPMIIPSPKRAL